MTPAELAYSIVRAARDVAVERGHDPSVVPGESRLERPRSPGRGDFTSTIALRMASRTGDCPRELAGAIVARLVAEAASRARHDRGTSFEVVPPGFVNVRLSAAGMGTLACTVVSQGGGYGTGTRLAGAHVDLAGECRAESGCLWELSAAGGSRLERAREWSLTRVYACLVRQSVARLLTAAGATVSGCGEHSDFTAESGAEIGTNQRSFGYLVAVAGPEAARYHLVRSRAYFMKYGEKTDGEDGLGALAVFDQVARHTLDNPAYYVRYLAALATTMVRNAQAAGVDFGSGYHPDLLVHEKELALLAALRDYPWVVDTAAEDRAPYQVARFLEKLAATYHDFSDRCQLIPKGDEPANGRMRARLWLHAATRVVFSNGLALLGVRAPDRM